MHGTPKEGPGSHEVPRKSSTEINNPKSKTKDMVEGHPVSKSAKKKIKKQPQSGYVS